MSQSIFLPFEKEVQALHQEIEELRLKTEADHSINLSKSIEQLQEKKVRLMDQLYAKLSPWDIVQIARHPLRPYTLDYIEAIFTDFTILHGDRLSEEDHSIVGGLASFKGVPCMVIGHQKGRNTKERAFRHFGMSQPAGYRKVVRLLKMAEKFNLPVFTFVDTPGAYPGIEAEEKGQAQAIGQSIYEMTQTRVPIIVSVIGEGGSGGALALGVGDYVQMLKYAVYSVISPEGCASILWKDVTQAEVAAKALHLTAQELLDQGLIDYIVQEPVGAAHRHQEEVIQSVQDSLWSAYQHLNTFGVDELIERRLTRLMGYGQFKDTKA